MIYEHRQFIFTFSFFDFVTVITLLYPIIGIILNVPIQQKV